MTSQTIQSRAGRGKVHTKPQRAEGGTAICVYKKYLPNIQKRDGRIVPFEFGKIVSAIEKSMTASNEGSADEAAVVAHQVAGGVMRNAEN